MSGQLQTATLNAPGFFGLNSQDSEVTLESGYATTASNCIIDRSGRLASRRGWLPVTTDNGTLADTDDIKTLFEFKDTTGAITYLSAGGGKLFKGLTTLTELPLRNQTDNGNIALTTTNDNWQVATLNFGLGVAAEAEVFFGQNGNPLILYHSPTSDYIFQRVDDIGSIPSGLTVDTFDPNCVLSAYGRIWCANLTLDKHTIFYSRLLQGHDFNGAGAGILDISSVVGGNDEIVALADHNNFLIIFCKENILVYTGVETPANIQLVDVITGVGCIARDSVQKTGVDLIFLSKSGVRSLARTIQEKSLPMRELSLNVRDDVVNAITNQANLANIKSVYFERDAFYLITFPDSNIAYCFDMRAALPNNSARVTTWTGMNFKAFCTTESRELFLGATGAIARYREYTDNGSPYRMVYFTANSNLDAPSQLKFLKKGAVTTIGNNTQDYVIKYGFDYSTLFTSRVFASSSSATPAEYNTSEYGIGEYSGGLLISEIRLNLGGSGRVIKFGIETEINGAPVSIQKAEVFFKLGKLF